MQPCPEHVVFCGEIVGSSTCCLRPGSSELACFTKASETWGEIRLSVSRSYAVPHHLNGQSPRLTVLLVVLQRRKTESARVGRGSKAAVIRRIRSLCMGA